MLSDPSFRHSTRERTDFWLFLPNFGRDRSSVSQIQSVIRVQTHNSFLPGSYHTRTKVLSFAVTCRYAWMVIYIILKTQYVDYFAVFLIVFDAFALKELFIDASSCLPRELNSKTWFILKNLMTICLGTVLLVFMVSLWVSLGFNSKDKGQFSSLPLLHCEFCDAKVNLRYYIGKALNLCSTHLGSIPGTTTFY